MLPRFFLAAIILALGAGQAQAYPADYVDIDLVWEFLSEGESVGGNFDITAGNLEGDDFSGFFGANGENVTDVVGFDPLSEEVTAARASFLFVDGDMAADGAVIDLGAGELLFAGPQLFFITLAAFDVEFAVLTSLNETGNLDWTVTADPNATSGSAANDFALVFARLEAIVDDKSAEAPMPEPGSAVLLAVGMLVVSRALRRRS